MEPGPGVRLGARALCRVVVALLAATLFHSSGGAHAATSRKSSVSRRLRVSNPQPELTDDDFVVAISSASSRLVLAQGTRAWREGMRTLIMTSNETEVPHLNKVYAKYKERYEYFPDENDPDPKKWHAKFPGDFRAAVAPFAAHRHYGDNYKWMLYGDDDTVFFLPGVRKMLAQFDPEQPLALSDNLWHDSRHPRLEAFRCLPCGFDTTKLPAAQLRTNNSFVPRAACPHCTREMACPPGRPDCDITGAHGGAGMIFSVGLMRQAALSYDNALGCMYSIFGCSGGDGLVSQCIWRAGYGFTDPGHSLLHTEPYKHVLFDNMDGRWFLKDPIGQLVVGNCDEQCAEGLRHAVSYHVRGKSYPSFPKAAAFMYGVVEAHAAALDFIDLQADTAGRAGRAVGHRVLPARHVGDPHATQPQPTELAGGGGGGGAEGGGTVARKTQQEGEDKQKKEKEKGEEGEKEERRSRKHHHHHHHHRHH